MAELTKIKTDSTADSSIDPIPEAVQKAGGRIVSTVKQGCGLTLDAAREPSEATSAPPTPGLPVVPGADSLPDISALTTYRNDLAIEMLMAQRAFAADVAAVRTPQGPLEPSRVEAQPAEHGTEGD